MAEASCMFEANYVCLYDLMSFIPSLEDPTKSIKQDTLEFYNANPWNNKARLVVNGKATNFKSFGFNEQDQMELFALTAKPEIAANGKRLDEVFSDHFFTTNFWHMWKTLFALDGSPHSGSFRRNHPMALRCRRVGAVHSINLDVLAMSESRPLSARSRQHSGHSRSAALCQHEATFGGRPTRLQRH
jgi:myosin-crossreactive antigen